MGDAVGIGADRSELRAADDIAAPDLIDVETVSVLRKRWLRRTLTDQRFAAAIGHLQQFDFAHLQQFDFDRIPTLRLMARAFELRANVSAHDACYVALAEQLGCELLTVDGRLANASGPRSRSASCAETANLTGAPVEDRAPVSKISRCPADLDDRYTASPR